MQKFDACAGHKARINEFLLKKPPCIMSASSTSSVCEQCADEPPKALRKKRREKERNKRQLKYKMWTEGGDELRFRR